jgi:predicted lipid-binding transport protein (Tim44 family)
MVLFLIRTAPAMILERAVLLTRAETEVSTYEPTNPAATTTTDVSAGVAAIRVTDPAFDPSGLAGVAEAGYALVEQSLTSGDASPVRAVMGQGLWHLHRLVLGERVRFGVQAVAEAKVEGAEVFEVARGATFDRVRVRLRLNGWRFDRDAATGVTVRFTTEPRQWCEEWTFTRSVAATTVAGRGLLHNTCSSCGAPLQVDDQGACRWCHSVVMGGRHDWVLARMAAA